MQTMHIKLYQCVCILLVYMIIAVFAQQRECQGVKIIYPKPDSDIQQDLTYLILGNSENNTGYLVQVDIVQDTNEIVNTWKGHDDLLRVTAIQQNLSQLSKRASSNTFWFRATIEQDGRECQIESGKFKMTS